jgi:hypothetical protein
LCSVCRTQEEQLRRNQSIESIKTRLVALFDDRLQSHISNMFGMSSVTAEDRMMIGRLTRGEREEFRVVIAGIDTETFKCSTPSQSSSYPTVTQIEWYTALESGHPPYVKWDIRADRINHLFHQASYKTDLYCHAASSLRAGRHEDAANAFEKLTLFEEAGRVRKMALQEHNTSRNVSVNMNQLIDQVRAGGLALAYKCPSCGGSIRIDKDYNPGMKMCGYSGTPLDMTVMASLLKNL